MQSSATGYDIAVIGVAGRFPGAATVDQFWRNLCAGVESVKFFTDEELRAAGEAEELLRDPHYVKAQPVLDGFDRFDASFFGFAPQDAAIMDPQHRVFLEVGWEALEDAGHEAESFSGNIGVFATCGMNTYMMYNLVNNRRIMDTIGEWLVRHTGNDMNFLATRLSYELNLKGPSMNVQTACSSALVAIHLACLSLLNGECDLALAGGSTIVLPQNRGYLYKPNEILSPDGHCRPFDAKARGTLFGSGAGVVVLRRLADAQADGDRILAVVKGSAINNDGSGKVGYLAPSVEGQSRVITEALTLSGVHPETISYVEAHGTGTIVGDPIEVAALTQAYRHFTAKKGFCALGSVKSNIGHLGEAAGVAAFIKTVLALQHRLIPPSLHYESPNPQIDFANSPFFVNAQAAPWPASTGPRRAGITALGAGGTNCHVIVEEPPALPESGWARPWQLLLLSAARPAALEKATENLGRHLKEHPDLRLADVAYTLHAGRKAFEHRRALVCRDHDQAIAACASRQGLLTASAPGPEPKVAFLFPGQGAQHPNMARGLYESEPVFRAEVDQVAEILKRERGLELREIVFTSAPAEQACPPLSQTALAQPALFLIEYALAKLWMSWGVKPYAMLGHSIGEYVAACLAGVLSLPEAITLVADRGRLMQQAPPGAMLAVALPPDEVERLLERTRPGVELALAVINGPEQSVVGGPGAPIAGLQAELEARGIPCRRLETSHAFHSPMMDPILASYGERVRRVKLCPPTIPYLSNLTGTWIRPEEATEPDYWVRHLRQPVRFSECLSALLANRDQLVLEVGPGRSLCGLVRQQANVPAAVIPCLGRAGEEGRDVELLLRAAGHLWVQGCKLDAARFYEGQGRRRVALPTYPFERQSFWIEADRPSVAAPCAPPAEATAAVKKSDLADWFYLPTWKRSLPPLVVRPAGLAADWLVFLDESGLGADLIEHLRRPGRGGANLDAVRLEIAEAGNIDRLSVRPDERRPPGPGEVEIRVGAAALNFADVLKVAGVLAEAPFGMECAGVIERVGAGVSDFRPGEEVVAIGPESFRSYVIRSARHVAHKPAFLSMEEAVTLPAAFMTAWYALHHLGQLQHGEKVLIHAASGGVGLAAVQVARLTGAEIFATAGSQEKRDFLQALGIRHVFDSRSHGFAEAILERTRGAGVDVVLNSLTGAFIPKSLAVLAAGGRFLELGKREVYSRPQLAALPLRPNISYFPIDLTQLLCHDPEAYGRLLREVIEQADQRRFEPLPRHVFAFAQAAEAFRLMLQTRHIGKIVLTMGPAAPAVYTVRAGSRFQQLNARDFILQPGNPAHYTALLEALEKGAARVGHIAHLWSVTPDTDDRSSLEKILERGFFSLTWLAKALSVRDWTHAIDLAVLATGLHQIGGETTCQPAKATLHGPCRVIPRELATVTCRSIDVPATTAGSWQRERLVHQLTAELLAKPPERVVAYRNNDRWVQDYEPAPLQESDEAQGLSAAVLSAGQPAGACLRPRLRRGGVYLITGGLGDLGLELAEYFARAAAANLILISRSAVPPRSDWEQWLRTHDERDRTSAVIRRLQACEAAGGSVFVAAADVSDRRRLRSIVAEACKRFGAIHGVVHAAGSLDDGLIQLKTTESALRVLAPKVKGTLVLDDVLRGQSLDFFVLFSSISSLLGFQGQVDYTAANAFLDAFAAWRSARCAGQTVSINWSAWQDVGMAARTVRPSHGRRPRAGVTPRPPHPWLECRQDQAGGVVFVTAFSRARQWLLAEHALRGGAALIPGTGFLELARAAFVEVANTPAVEISRVVFQTPFAVAHDETKELTLSLRPGSAGWDFEITSHGGRITHVTGHVGGAAAAAPKRIDIHALTASCADRTEVLDGHLRQSFMEFGPRWANVRQIDFGRDQALLTLELPAAFASDLDSFPLHPALLDMATGGAQPLLPGFDSCRDFYVPFSYGRLVLWKGLCPRLYSHVRLRAAKSSAWAVFDVTIADENGTVLAEVSEFTMKRVAHPFTEVVARIPDDGASLGSAASLASAILRHGIAPAKGLEAFERILACAVAPQIIVSPVDPHHWLKQADALIEKSRAAALQAATPRERVPAAAAALRNGAAGRDQIELHLKELYSQMLGVHHVGLQDDFFDLGGHSLLATRVVSRIRDTFGVEVPLRDLFEAPTVAALAARIEAAFAEKQAVHAPALVAVARAGDLVLSFAQQRLWFLDQLEPHKSVYNLPFAVRLTGPVDVLVLERVLAEVVRRHEVLRTTFHAVDGQPVQRIGPAVSVPLPVVDLGPLPEAERESAARQWLAAAAGRPFDLSRDLLLRAGLVRLSAQEHILLLTMHHIASDGWSMDILSRELTALYQAYSAGQPSPLAALPLQYGDYAVWQRQWLQGAALAQSLAYWKDQLAGAPPLLELPTDHPRPALQSYRGNEQVFVLDRELCQALQELSQRHEATLFMTLLAAFQILLYRYSGQEDIVIGSPIAGRTRTEIEGLIGFFVNTLALRTNLSGNPSFRELLAQVREITLGAYAHQDLPFEKLVEELQPERTLGHAPLFQVMFVLHNASPAPLELPGLTVEPLAVNTGTAKFDLTLSLAQDGERLRGTLEYNTDLFEAETIARLLGNFRQLLQGIAADPEQRIGELPLLTEAERQQLLLDWNRTETDFPQLCLHELFAAQAARTPQAIAVQCEGRQLTYEQLDRQANQLAHRLRSMGARADVPIGILVDRSLEMVIAVLGVLKAGGACLPLDRIHPKPRLQYMVEKAGAALLLTQASQRERLPTTTLPVLCLDDPAAVGEQSARPLVSRASPEQLAYVLYTSGSTGRPKGVAMSHGPIVNLVTWEARRAGYGTGARTLQFASLGFDVCFQEMFTTWNSGGTLVVATEELRRDLASLWRMINREQIERLFLPVVVLQQLAELAERQALWPEALREVITAGEPLRITPPIRRLFRELRACRLVNQYGPTEAHVVTSFTLVGHPDTWPELPPIGRPIDNARIYLLQRNQQPAPIGVAGELHIGGVCLARGYVNEPQLTSERFITSPFAHDGGGRLYKTGDLARYRPDGTIEFLGRADNQVKIRGFRIELSEIESVLCQHASLAHGAVTVEENQGDRRLVAYVVARDGQAIKPAELRGYLSASLPEYMIPSDFVSLDRLPVNINGKIDRQALRKAAPVVRSVPDSPEIARGQTQDPVQARLIKMWQELLHVGGIGVHDNFFELGGHSLLAVRLFAQIEKEFQKVLPLAQLFQTPTIAGLAAALQGTGAPQRKEFSVLVPFNECGKGPPLYFVHSVGGEAASFRHLARLLAPEHRFYGIQAPPEMQNADFASSVESVARHYVEAIMAFQPDGPFLLGGWSAGSTIALEMAQQLADRGRTVELLIALDGAPYNTHSATSLCSPLYYWKLICNFPLWIADDLLLEFSFPALARRVRNKALALSGCMVSALRGRPAYSQPVNGFMDVSHYSPSQVAFMNALNAALRTYVPKPYRGRVLLYKSRTQPLYHLLEVERAWQKIASQVDVVVVRGTHVTIVREPYIRTVAADLRKRLAVLSAEDVLLPAT